MILFFGTRPGKGQMVNLPNVKCVFCGQANTLSAWTQANYFHLFWIKIFKISTQKTIECSHCKRVYYKEDFTQEMVDALKQVDLMD